MENILYEYRFDIRSFLLYMIPVLIGAGLLVFALIFCRNEKRRVLGVILFIISFLSFMPVPDMCYMINDHIMITDAIKKGDYTTVNGYVSELCEVEENGETVMKFKIGDTGFKYADNTDYSGYHKFASKGGVISHDGQYLTVKYALISRPFRGDVLFFGDGRQEYRIVIIYISEPRL